MTPRLNPKKSYQNFNWLFRMYRSGLKAEQIADICEVSDRTIRKWKLKLHIEKYITQERYTRRYIEWRNRVLKRDGFRCVRCKSRKNVHAHHIRPWATHPKLRYEVSNGQTLCEDCHVGTHPWMRMLYDKRKGSYRPK